MVKVAVTNRTLQIAVIVVYGSWWLSNSVSISSHPVFVANQKTQLKIETMHWFSTLDSQSPNTKSVLLNWCYHISVESNWYSVFRPNADVYIRNTKVLTMIYWPTYTIFFFTMIPQVWLSNMQQTQQIYVAECFPLHCLKQQQCTETVNLSGNDHSHLFLHYNL